MYFIYINNNNNNLKKSVYTYRCKTVLNSTSKHNRILINPIPVLESRNNALFGVLGATSQSRPEYVLLSQGAVRLNSLVSLCLTEEVV